MIFKSAYFLLFALSLLTPAFSQDYSLARSSFVAANVANAESGSITLNWNGDSGAGNWVCSSSSFPKFFLEGTLTSWTHTGISKGQIYEFAYKKLQAVGETRPTVAGHISYGVEVPMDNEPGGSLLVCEEKLAERAGPELRDYMRDLEAEGWRVWLTAVPASLSPKAVRDQIAACVTKDASINHIILLGHVPVPYSGGRGFYPDGHREHEGAWPCDGYYADARQDTSPWPDMNTFVNTTATPIGSNNLPGDGIFDRNSFPTPLEYCVGRLDFSRLPGMARTEPDPELFLLRRYLQKARNFRKGKIPLSRKVRVEDTLRHLEDGPAKGPYRSYSVTLGANCFETGSWVANATPMVAGVHTAYGAVSDGKFNATQFASHAQLANGRINSVFNHLFGSYFGDWDNEDNFLRSVIAAPGVSLCAMWDGRPSYALHHMALGRTLGCSVRFSMSSTVVDGYDPGIGGRGVHMGLLGDPTLMLLNVPAPEQVTATLGGTVTAPVAMLTWDAALPTDGGSPVQGYHVYRSFGPGEPYLRVTNSLLTDRTFTDVNVTTTSRYQVKSLRLEVTPSGSYWNQSCGATTALRGGSIHPIDLWKRQYFGAAWTIMSDHGDYDKDSIPNLLEYTLGLNPRIPDANPLLLRIKHGQLEVEYLEPTHASVNIVLEECSQLGKSAWKAVPPTGMCGGHPGWGLRRHCLGAVEISESQQRYFRLRSFR